MSILVSFLAMKARNTQTQCPYFLMKNKIKQRMSRLHIIYPFLKSKIIMIITCYNLIKICFDIKTFIHSLMCSTEQVDLIHFWFKAGFHITYFNAFHRNSGSTIFTEYENRKTFSILIHRNSVYFVGRNEIF